MIKYSEAVLEFRRNGPLMDELLKYHRQFRNLISLIAHYGVQVIKVANPPKSKKRYKAAVQANPDIFNVDKWEPRAIYKCEGGLVVNGCELVLRDSVIRDDWDRKIEETVEEKATLQALEYVIGHIKTAGDVQKGLMAATEEFLNARVDWTEPQQQEVLAKIKGTKADAVFGGDPWRNFFGEAWQRTVSAANAKAKAEGRNEAYF